MWRKNFTIIIICITTEEEKNYILYSLGMLLNTATINTFNNENLFFLNGFLSLLNCEGTATNKSPKHHNQLIHTEKRMQEREREEKK